MTFTIKGLAVALGLLAITATSAGSQPIDVQKYAVPVYMGVRAHPKLTGNGGRFAMFRTRIRDGFAANAIVAGHYTIIQIGCGTGCTWNIVGDLRSGDLVGFPISGEAYPGVQFITDPKSRLFYVKWSDVAFTACKTRLYLLDGLQFTQIGRDGLRDKSCFE